MSSRPLGAADWQLSAQQCTSRHAREASQNPRRASSTTTFAHAGLKNTNTQSAENETVASCRVYDAFGNVVSSSGTWSGPFGYAGNFGYQEDPSGLKLLGHRFYNPQDGRFLTNDPAGDGANWYSYVHNRPVTRFDETGEFGFIVVAAIVVIVFVLSGEVAEAPTHPLTTEEVEAHRYQAASDKIEIGANVAAIADVIGELIAPVTVSIRGALAAAAAKEASEPATLSKADLLSANVAKGKAAEQAYAKALDEAGINYLPQPVTNVPGLGRRIHDFAIYDDAWNLVKFVEVKSGNAVYGGLQKAKDEAIAKLFGIETEVVRMQ